MASSSTSSFPKSFKYDVFLSFRGEDTRTSFIDHLFYALQQKCIHTYTDDERIKKGKRISDELIASIEDSKFYVIVFSKNYASSSWCLDELVKIMECHKTTKHTAYPVFYDVEPWEVREQSGVVGEAFCKHGKEKEEVSGKWRDALKDAADLAGWELKNIANGHEAKFVQKIVEELSLELRSINYSIDEKLVGMDTRIKGVVSSLETCFDDVCIIGIKGIGGGGKTTLARAVFDQISFQFEGKSFVANVKEGSKASLSGLTSLQNQVLSDVLNDQGNNVSNVYDGKNMMKRMMPDRKILVVLDDVDHINQLEALAGEPNWFKPGSVIIITTRDEQVLIAHGVKLIHNVNLLSDMEAVCLFSRHAFRREIPIQGHEEFSRQVVRYAAGLPLTIRVLGSFLCGKSELEWVDAVERLKTIPLVETLEKLELSYISLEEDYKEIFITIACILKGWYKDRVIKVLESCGFHARNGLRVLEQKSLITIDFSYNPGRYGEYVSMHDHLEEMGMNIVRRSHPNNPNKHSQLWIKEEIKDILANDLGTEATRYMIYKPAEEDQKIVTKGLRKMKELRFLDMEVGRLGWRIVPSCWNWKFIDVIPYLPNSLQCLCWTGYPFRSLSKTFQANNLVGIEMRWSKIVQLWKGGERKVLNKLRFLDLNHSRRLRTLDLRLAPNLETLDLDGCDKLVKLHMPDGCLKLRCLKISSELRTLDLRLAPNLETLDLDGRDKLVKLHMPDGCLKLRCLKISSELRTLDLRLAPNLETLDLDGRDKLVKLHMPDGCLKLRYLKIWSSKLRIFDLGLAPNLETLNLRGCDDLVELHKPSRYLNLRSLTLRQGKLRTLVIGPTPNLNNLIVEQCEDLEELHMDNECQELVSVIISSSKLRILRLGATPNLENLALSCTRIRRLPHSICMSKHLKSLIIEKSFLEKLPEELGRLECLEVLIVDSAEIIGLPDSICTLKHLECLGLTCSMLEKLPEDLGRLKCLEGLYLSHTKIKHLPDSICTLKHLKSLQLTCSMLEKLPEDLGRLECLEFLYLLQTKIKHLPDSICMLKYLYSLILSDCPLLEKLPDDLGRLEGLRSLRLPNCVRLQHIPDSICKIKNLEELNIQDTSISSVSESLLLLKGLTILASREVLQSFGFTSEIQPPGYRFSAYHVKV